MHGTNSPIRKSLMRPQSLEELLYQKLVQSPTFNAWVKRVYARINRIPVEERDFNANKTININDYTPTIWQRMNAFRKILGDELKNAFLFKS